MLSENSFRTGGSSAIFLPMKTPLKLSLTILVLSLLTGCFRNDLRTEKFKIEQLRSPEAVRIIANALQPVAGIKEIRPDYQNHELIVIFNGLECYIKNIEYAIVKAGFDLPNWPADPSDKTKLPEDLR
jgi:hypothetical protein